MIPVTRSIFFLCTTISSSLCDGSGSDRKGRSTNTVFSSIKF